MNRRNLGFYVATAVAALTMSFSTIRAVDVSGTIATTTWTAANSPYRVTGTVTIPSGNTLTIESGVDVLFDADVQFIVQGAIHAHGTEIDSVRFVKGNATEWGGLRISGADSSSFVYTRISDGNARGSEPEYRGGAIYADGEGIRLTVSNCVFSNNTAYAGGCIYNRMSKMTLINCILSENSADYGGAIRDFGSSTTLTNCTFFGNSADINGGGVYAEQSTVSAANSIFWDNSAPTGPQVGIYDESITVRYSDIEGGYTGTGNINVDPLFRDAAGGDFRLTEGSPCIDAGDPTSPLDPDGTRADMGAFWFSHESIQVLIPEITTQSGSYVEIPIYATADQVMSATLVFTFNPLMFVDGLHGIAVNAPAWYTQNPWVEPEGIPTGENLSENVFVDYNMDYIEEAGYLRVVVASSDARSFYGEALITISGQLIENLAGNVMPLVWSAADVEINGEPVMALTDGSLEVNDPPVWSHPPAEISVTEYQEFEIPLIADDPEGQVLFYELVNGPQWLAIHDDALSGIPKSDDIGISYDITLSVSDNINDPVEYNFTINVTLYFGDVTENGTISALDATQILKYAVKKIDTIDLDRGDVSRAEYSEPGAVSSWDAALILYKVVNPAYFFPVQGGLSPLESAQQVEKLAFTTPASLKWVRTAGGWALSASGVGPIGTDLVLRMPENAFLSSDVSFDYSRDGELVTIAAASVDGTELFRVGNMSDSPEVLSVLLNGVETSIATPVPFDLAQNAPNPFNPVTSLRFGIPEACEVLLTIYDVNGRFVRTLVDANRAAGMHEVVWDARDDAGRAVASGVYVYRLTAGADVAVRRMVLLR